ncbi:DMT family transporter [Dokdonella sp.]|uniref:DMT family transporter n=1 Tax=Dokdonella sp. TaxID=2291710 RepID=UPI002DD63CBD|nr:DMT family transporter [Dokdonella sp.]
MTAGRASPPARLLRGSLWMLVAGALFSLMGVMVKLGASGSQPLSSGELVFYRSLFGLLGILPGVLWRRQSLFTPNWRWHLSRSLIGTAGVSLHFFAIATLPLATAVTLNYTAPIFLTMLTLLMSRRWPGVLPIFGILLGFVGVVMLLRPVMGRELLLPSLFGLAGGLCGGLAFFSTRQLGERGEPPWRVVFYFTAVSTFASGLWVLWQGYGWPPLSALPVLIGMGASATLAQLAMTRAYKEGDVLIVGSLSYSTVAFTSLLGILLWSEWLAPGEWLGLALIVASGVLATRVGNRERVARA